MIDLATATDREVDAFFSGIEWIAERLRTYPAPNMDAVSDDILDLVSLAKARLGIDN